MKPWPSSDKLGAFHHHWAMKPTYFNMLSRTVIHHQRCLLPLSRLHIQPQIRTVTNAALRTSLKPPQARMAEESSPLSKIPMGVLLRSVALTTVMANKWLLRPSLAFIALITQSNSAILHPDKNPVLSRILQWTIYDHFCAGNSITEVSNTVKYIKKLGFHGIILGYSKDVVLDPNVKLPTAGVEDYPKECYDMIDEWKKGNIDTLNMIEAGDLLAVK